MGNEGFLGKAQQAMFMGLAVIALPGFTTHSPGIYMARMTSPYDWDFTVEGEMKRGRERQGVTA